MTTKPSIGKRLLGVMLAVPMALAGMGIGATTAVAADTVPTDNLIAAYDFTTKPSDGKTVANSAPNATLGAAEVQNSADSLWADSALTLSGGAKTGSGDWVKLPSNLLPGKDGMVHISKLSDRRVEKVEDVVNIGDMIWVKVTDIDEKGRVNLSLRDAQREIAAMEARDAKKHNN